MATSEYHQSFLGLRPIAGITVQNRFELSHRLNLGERVLFNVGVLHANVIERICPFCHRDEAPATITLDDLHRHGITHFRVVIERGKKSFVYHIKKGKVN